MSNEPSKSENNTVETMDVRSAALKAAESLKDPERQKKAIELANKMGQKSQDMDVRAARKEALQTQGKSQQKSKGQDFDR